MMYYISEIVKIVSFEQQTASRAVSQGITSEHLLFVVCRRTLHHEQFPMGSRVSTCCLYCAEEHCITSSFLQVSTCCLQCFIFAFHQNGGAERDQEILKGHEGIQCMFFIIAAKIDEHKQLIFMAVHYLCTGCNSDVMLRNNMNPFLHNSPDVVETLELYFSDAFTHFSQHLNILAFFNFTRLLQDPKRVETSGEAACVMNIPKFAKNEFIPNSRKV